MNFTMTKFQFQDLKGKTLLGVDYGEKVIGLALYKVDIDPFPMPFDRIIVKNHNQTKQDILSVIEDEVVDIVIMGLPLLTDGNESKMTLTVKKYTSDLNSLLESKGQKIPIYLQDETLSSYEAEERMKNDPRYNFKVDLQKIDALAASIIIEQFLQEQVDKE